MSSLLFLLVAEVMALKIRNSDVIYTMQIGLVPRREIKLYDSLTLFLKYYTDKIIGIFGRMPGLKLNKTKTERLWIGKYKKCKLASINWSNEVEALGI